MTAPPEAIDLADLQGLVVFRRPAPYWSTQVLLHVNDADRGRRLLAGLLPHLTSAADWVEGHRDATAAVALTHPGLAALALSAESLASFPAQLREGMAARAQHLGDTGDSAPENWDAAFRTRQVHLAVSVTAASQPRYRDMVSTVLSQVEAAGATTVARNDGAAFPGTRTTFGYRDGISFPNIAGLPPSPMTTPEPPLATGEFLLGHPSETGAALPMPIPDVLGRNGSYFGIRKIHTRVAAFRQFLRANASDAAGEELLAAKLLGRWRSGAPLILAPDHDDVAVANDATRINNFTYADDRQGLICPHGAHIRRLRTC